MKHSVPLHSIYLICCYIIYSILPKNKVDLSSSSHQVCLLCPPNKSSLNFSLGSQSFIFRLEGSDACFVFVKKKMVKEISRCVGVLLETCLNAHLSLRLLNPSILCHDYTCLIT